MNKTVLIIEDHALTRIGLKTAFEKSGLFKAIKEAEYGEEGLKLAESIHPDVIVLDLGLPGINGIEVIKQLKNSVNSKIIVLTSHEDKKEVIEAITNGANAYCLKDIDPERLVSIIDKVIDGGFWVDESVSEIIRNSLEINSPPKTSIPLTDREIEILQLIADCHNNKKIAQMLSVSHYTVKSHMCNILHKLSVDDRTQALSIAMRNKWVK